MQYPNVEATNWRLDFKIIKRIFALFLSGALHLDGKQQPECHTITIFDQCKLLCNVIWIHPQMTAHSANWRLFKQFKRLLPCFHVVIDICMKTNPTFDNWKIVARVLSFKIVWIGAHSHPLKRTNAQKTAPAQDTQQQLLHIWKKGSRETKDNMTVKQMSFSTISTSFIYQNTQKPVFYKHFHCQPRFH